MRFPQVINTLLDNVMAIDGAVVIDDTTQLPLGPSVTTIDVDIHLLNINDNSHVSSLNKTMTYNSNVDHWTIDMVDIASILLDQKKYVGFINENAGSSENMRTFKLIEFAVDIDGLELTLMRLPFELVIGESDAFYIWYEDGHIGEPAYKMFTAPAYEGGVGTIYATDTSRVTHRGAVTRYYPPS